MGSPVSTLIMSAMIAVRLSPNPLFGQYSKPLNTSLKASSSKSRHPRMLPAPLIFSIFLCGFVGTFVAGQVQS